MEKQMLETKIDVYCHWSTFFFGGGFNSRALLDWLDLTTHVFL